MANKRFKTVEEYYSWGSQGNSFAPKYKDLADSAKAQWIKMFNEYLEEQGE